MSPPAWLWIVLGALIVLEGLRLRHRLGALVRLERSERPVSPEHRFIIASGVELDEATRRAASAHMSEQGLEALDLIPGDFHTSGSMALAKTVDLRRYRAMRFTPGATAGHAIVVTVSLHERARLGEFGADDPLAFRRIALKAKRYACTDTGLAVAPALRGRPIPAGRRWAMLRDAFGDFAWLPLVWQPIGITTLALGFLVAPWVGAVALGAMHLQPVAALAGGPLAPRDLWLFSLFRSPIEIWIALRIVTSHRRVPDEPDPIEVRRPEYDRLLANPPPFFEKRRETCPLCEGGHLAVLYRFRDLLQGKPGRFTLERCEDCGHIFQNPRLSIAGLDFYYRDFYDGLGERSLDVIFGASEHSYRARAELVASEVQPRKWLDVGGGHGHFCCAARETFPQARFEILDLSESAEEAARRGWADGAIRGLFPDLRGDLSDDYDVVSMSHYLEHTREPKAEIAAASQVLRTGGVLLIEVPDPSCRLGRLLRSYWLPWFQPQHQHFVSYESLEKILDESGFDLVRGERGPPHQPVDFFFAVALALNRLAPKAGPWRPAPSVARRGLNGVVRVVGVPLMLSGWLLDRLLSPLLRRRGWSNTYRLLARKRG